MKRLLAILLTIATLMGVFSASFSVSADVGDYRFYEQENNDFIDCSDRIYNDYTVLGLIDGLDIDRFVFTVYQSTKVSVILSAKYSTLKIVLANQYDDFFDADEVSYSSGNWYGEIDTYVEPGTYYIILWDDYEYLDNTYAFHITFEGDGVRWGTWKQHSDGRWWFAYDEGGYATGWENIDDVWYYFDANGWMQTGWHKLSGKWYYFDSDGAMQTGWEKIKGVWYYFNADGDMATGWGLIGGKWYYFNPSGAMQIGWKQIGGTWYYFNAGGDMATGWLKQGGRWYYLNSSGAMQIGWKYINNNWYFFYSSGVMATGYVNIDGVIWHFNSSGAMIA